ncbi:MAG: cytochrome c biosis protein CcdA [Bacillales bacterium]|jgi:cytochrome c-type biogenesis protein|nr:cytochrome c biosis protein CcdA [Bacillales bacterium]
MDNINYFTAFTAGILSFISPCVLPIYPAFLSYITGMTVNELKEERGMFDRNAILHTIIFLLGFSIIYIAIGFATSFIGSFFYGYKDVIRISGGILIILFGMMITGLLNIPYLLQNHRFEFKNRPAGYIGTFFIGLAFSAGWTPCMGPTLGYVISLAATNPGSGLVYMIAYILGFSIPFIFLSFFIGKMTWLKRNSEKVVGVGGVLMIFMGFILVLDWMPKITSYLLDIFGSFGNI